MQKAAFPPFLPPTTICGPGPMPGAEIWQMMDRALVLCSEGPVEGRGGKD